MGFIYNDPPFCNGHFTIVSKITLYRKVVKIIFSRIKKKPENMN